MENEPKPIPREGNTERELQGWLDGFPQDSSLKLQAEFIVSTVGEWKNGTVSSEEALRSIWRQYFESEDKDSEAAKVVLSQASMWFCYEADIPFDTDWAIMQGEKARAATCY